MATNNRIYTVTNNLGQKRLVRTYSPSAAIAHVARSVLAAHVATPDELIDLTKNGVEVEAPTSTAADEGDAA